MNEQPIGPTVAAVLGDPCARTPDLYPLPPAAVVKELRSGDLCPRCREQRLDYDGMLNLSCPNCGILSSGCFT